MVKTRSRVVAIVCAAWAAGCNGSSFNSKSSAIIPCQGSNGETTDCEGPGGLRFNGTRTQPTNVRADSVAAAGLPQNFFTAAGFLFEPESPYASLKSVPT